MKYKGVTGLDIHRDMRKYLYIILKSPDFVPRGKNSIN